MRISLSFSLSFMLACVSAHRQLYAIPATRPGNYIGAEEHSTRKLSVRSTPLETALEHLKSVAPDAQVNTNADQYTDEDTGITHIYFTQSFNGLPIENAQANVNLRKDGTILSSGESLVKGKFEAPPIARRELITDPLEALKAVIKTMDYPMKADEASANAVNSFSGGDNTFTFSGVEGAVEEPTANLIYYATDDGVKLAWRFETNLDDSYMITYANAHTAGEVLGAVDYVSDASYRVYKFGDVNDPSKGSRELLTNPAHPDASPNGWHQVGTTTYTDTRGNNAMAHENFDGGDDFLNNVRPSGGSSLTFDFPYNPTATDAKSYISAAVTNLFYTVNMFHDLLEVLGFTEAAGNFEDVNTGPGGVGGDGVVLMAQDGKGFNNANFLTRPDGQRGVMRMYLWTPNPLRDGDFDTSIVVHEYAHGLSNRLTGGPARSNCLAIVEAGGMGEGWGDFYGTALRIKATDTRNSDFELAEWASGGGIRNYPYSTSLTRNPLMYSTVMTSGYTSVHPIGTIWATILYEVMWNLEEKHGYNSDPFPTFKAGTKIPLHGRQLAMKLVLEGMKLHPCNPTFVSARNGILDADMALTGGANRCELWRGFAKRGLGIGAISGSYVNNFAVPPGCPPTAVRKDFKA